MTFQQAMWHAWANIFMSRWDMARLKRFVTLTYRGDYEKATQ